METSLHKLLKTHYALPGAKYEEKLGKFRIDVLNEHELIEIQHGSFAAIRQKIRQLIVDYPVRVVKPIIMRKTIVKLAAQAGSEVSRRLSPKQGTLLDIFSELIYFRDFFPHPQLTVEVALVEVDEVRYPGHGRRRRWSRNDFVVADQSLTSVQKMITLNTPQDLMALLPHTLPKHWTTSDLAKCAGITRSTAQRIAYCLNHMHTTCEVGKQGNSRIYRFKKRLAA
jgi:hypothetical protein